jgi:hypothetical protein
VKSCRLDGALARFSTKLNFLPTQKIAQEIREWYY